MRTALAVAAMAALALTFAGCPSKNPTSLAQNAPPVANATPSEPQFSQGVQEVDEEAPRFSIQDLEGNTVTRDDFTNKVLILDFWATWCGACVAKLQAYTPILTKYRDKGVELLAVSLDSGPEQPAAWAKKTHFPFRIAMANEEMIKDYLGDTNQSITIPQVRIIDRDGNLRYKLEPSSTEQDLELAINKLLAEKVGGDASVDNATSDEDPAHPAAPHGK
jgi:peroxiredoxin